MAKKTYRGVTRSRPLIKSEAAKYRKIREQIAELSFGTTVRRSVNINAILHRPNSVNIARSMCCLHVADCYGFCEALQGITSRNELLCHETVEAACDDGLGDGGVIQLL